MVEDKDTTKNSVLTPEGEAIPNNRGEGKEMSEEEMMVAMAKSLQHTVDCRVVSPANTVEDNFRLNVEMLKDDALAAETIKRVSRGKFDGRGMDRE